MRQLNSLNYTRWGCKYQCCSPRGGKRHVGRHAYLPAPSYFFGILMPWLIFLIKNHRWVVAHLRFLPHFQSQKVVTDLSVTQRTRTARSVSLGAWETQCS